jgi:uncharacterized protein YbbC (DUF1343 family)
MVSGMTRLISLALILPISWIILSCDRAVSGEQVLKTGAERLVEQEFSVVEGMRVGVITNHTALAGGRHIVDLLHEADHVEVAALFGPEHGIRGDADAGERITDGVDERTGVPVYSLYGETRQPTPEMLDGLDALIFDIQDVGARFYTYISTMGLAMQSAARHDIRFVVLDRPNPLGGDRVEGFILEPGFESFVGLYPIPVTHGMTVGELALMIRGEAMLEDVAATDLHVVEVRGWTRDMLWSDLGRPWIPPSPNIPDFETAVVYPGTCFFEATNASEGRGTYSPFLQVGAPWADGEELARTLNERQLPGLRFEPVVFTPQPVDGMSSHPKHQGTELQGVSLIVEDPRIVEPVPAGMHLLEVFYKHAPDHEKEHFADRTRLARLAGTDRLYELLTGGATADEIIAGWDSELGEYLQTRSLYLIYD